MAIEVGSIVEGLVTGITNFGAFVELPGGVVGLVHISEVADTYVKDVKDFLKDKEKVTVKVISIDGNGKIGLSIKQAKPQSEVSSSASGSGRPPMGGRPMGSGRPPMGGRPMGGGRPPMGGKPPMGKRGAPLPLGFEDRLSKFLKDSDERQQDLKKNTESKRGGRGGRKY